MQPTVKGLAVYLHQSCLKTPPQYHRDPLHDLPKKYFLTCIYMQLNSICSVISPTHKNFPHSPPNYFSQGSFSVATLVHQQLKSETAGNRSVCVYVQVRLFRSPNIEIYVWNLDPQSLLQAVLSDYFLVSGKCSLSGFILGHYCNKR